MQSGFKKIFSLLLFSLSFAVMFISCNPTASITGMDISSLYSGKQENSLKINQLFHINDSVSAINILIPAGLILPEPGTRIYTKKGTLKYEIIGEGKRIGLTDSASFSITDTSEFQSYISHNWNFRATAGIDYFVRVTYTVPGIADDFVLLEFFSKKNRSCQPWFRFQSESGQFLSNNLTSYSQPLRLITTDSNLNEIKVKFYSRNFPPPIPPFVEQYRAAFSYVPDSSFSLQITNGRSSFFIPEQTGFYFFTPDSTLREGPTIFRMHNGFPKVTQHAQMLEVLRYITSKKEFEILQSYDIPKVAVDSFWIANAGRADLATELIRKYYQRVETANKLYTSFTDGWKTDRGMIYIVFGKPTSVYRSFEQEVWIYGDYDDARALKFYFNKAVNPFSSNDYVLIRNQYYKSMWYQNVQLWRR